eukprot:337922-Lingulodinium_polyedra.AAC.1
MYTPSANFCLPRGASNRPRCTTLLGPALAAATGHGHKRRRPQSNCGAATGTAQATRFATLPAVA